jgi:hypothetical protein
VVPLYATFGIDASLEIFKGTLSFRLLLVEEHLVTILLFAGGFGSLIKT